ncbi:MAG TPA: right-handed parallel beta-helix repeat-containing protein [Bacteroidales bacterium]|nr:right-handed parallel beta-helix repeat-containing protein [Bacteroidales bacterium]
MNYTFKSLIPYMAIFLLAIACEQTGTDRNRSGIDVYYVSPDGDDENPGTQDKPWKSVDKVNGIELEPGDSVFFKGGAMFVGMLKLDSTDSGDQSMNVVISSYGEGKATINGGKDRALYAQACNYLLIKNIGFSGDGRKEGNLTDGVLVMNSDFVQVERIEVQGFQHSGLHISGCDNARITRVYAHDNGFAGIHVTGSIMNDPEKYDNHNLYIGYCVAENNPGDPTVLKNHSGNGILASSVEEGTIEYCESFNNGWDMPWNGNGPVGIWIWDCTKFIIQHCISHDNKTHPGARDGGGFDFDGGVSNSILQYCLSFNNEGTGIGLYEFGASKPWQNNTIRYNISLNDGKTHDGSLGIWKAAGGNMHNCEIYNNTFYNSNPKGNIIWLDSSMPGFAFRNNVFVYTGQLLYEGNHFRHEVFQGNLYWNLSGGFNVDGFKSLDEWARTTGNEKTGTTISGRYTDPQLSFPKITAIGDPSELTPEKLFFVSPKEGSPLIDNGLNLKEISGIDPGDKDLFGTLIPQGNNYDIGAIEYVKK